MKIAVASMNLNFVGAVMLFIAGSAGRSGEGRLWSGCRGIFLKSIESLNPPPTE